MISFIINLTELKCHSRNRHFVLLSQPVHLAPEKPSRYHLSRIIFSFRTGDLGLLGATRASYPSPSGSEQPLNLVTAGSRLLLWEMSVYVKMPVKGPLRRTLAAFPIFCSYYHECGGIGVVDLHEWKQKLLITSWKHAVQGPIQCPKVGLRPHFNKKCVYI